MPTGDRYDLRRVVALAVAVHVATPLAAAAPLGGALVAFLGFDGACSAPGAAAPRLFAARFDLDARVWAVSAPSDVEIPRAAVCAAPAPTLVVDATTGRAWHFLAMCDNSTVVAAWQPAGDGSGAPAFAGACSMSVAGASPVGADARAFAHGPLLVNAADRSVLGVSVPAAAGGALPPCGVTRVARLAGDGALDPHGQFALDGSADAGFPPMLLYVSPWYIVDGRDDTAVNTTAFAPATGAVTLDARGVRSGVSKGGPAPPVLSVFRRRVVNAGPYYNGRTGAEYYAFGAANASLAEAGLKVAVSATDKLPLDILVPVQLWVDSGAGEWPLNAFQVTAWARAPGGCWDAGGPDVAATIVGHAPSSTNPDYLAINVTAVPLAGCPLPAPAACAFAASVRVASN